VLKAAVAAESRGWAVSEQKDRDYVKELQAKGMKVSPPSEAVAKELRKIGEVMAEEWLKTAGAEGKQIVDAYRAKH
jgi:TRAP-type C4-dicarboxylate transport system substrate-binding protein